MMAKHGVSWRTLILGALLGYLMAVMTMTTSSSDSDRNDAFDLRRFLSHGGEEVEKVGEEEASGEGEEHGVDADAMDITVAAIVVLLIVLTIAFEEAKHHIEHTADRSMKPIIASLFGEMTVLGFLSIFTFCVTQLGVFTELSMSIFGHEEEEELLETFETVHYMLFFIMVFFVTSVLSLVGSAKTVEKKWRTMNRSCQDEAYMEQAYAIPGDYPTNFLSYLCNFLMPGTDKKDYRNDLKLFAAVRQEFLLERSLEPPFEPHATNKLPADFDFGRYLSINLAHTLQHTVHVQISTWVFFAFLTLGLTAVMWAVQNEAATFAWIWVGFGWAFFLFGKYVDFHVLTILQAMAAPRASPENGSSESNALLDSTLPAWTKIDLEEYKANGRSCFTRNMTSDHVTRQDSLYWLDRSGPKLYNILTQIQLVFSSAYITMLLLSFYPYAFHEQSTSYAVSYLILSLFPLAFRVIKKDLSSAKLTSALSIGVHRRPNVIAQVIREEKTDRVIRAMVTMQKLQHAAQEGFVSPAAAATVNTSSGTMAEVSKIFDAFDKSKDGSISSDELKAVLTAVGSPPSEESLEAMLKVVDTSNDGNVTKDEFLAFYAANVAVKADEHSLHHLAHDMFQQFDTDKSGEITLGEFKDVLEAFNVGFTVDEIGDIVNELDEQNNGSIHAHEFHELLEKHKYLFEDSPLPVLE